MRLVPKLALALVPVVAGVMAFESYARVARAIESFETDMARDHVAIAAPLLAAVDHVRREEGEAQVARFIAEANARVPHVHLAWVWLERLPPEQARAVAARDSFSYADRGDPGSFVTYVADRPRPGVRRGAVEIRESLEEERTYARNAVLRNLRAALAVVGLHALSVWGMGLVLVQRPIKAMIEKSRRIADGDFSPSLEVRRKDELSDLAAALNEMCARLEHETTARERVQGQLRHADRLSTVGRLASGIAHELGTPLNVIAARAKIISAGRSPPETASDNARIIATQCERMTRIIRQLLDFARTKGTSRRGRVDLGEIARESCALFAPIARKRGIELEAPPPGPPIRVEADKLQLDQVVSNLILNAIQAVPDHGHVTVGVRAPDRPGGVASLFVKDDGPGISSEDLPHVFEPFFTTKAVGEGTGLGLSVAHGIVEDHGGRIAVESRPGEGACFTVYLDSADTPSASDACTKTGT